MNMLTAIQSCGAKGDLAKQDPFNFREMKLSCAQDDEH
jgi:hypothetical protein